MIQPRMSLMKKEELTEDFLVAASVGLSSTACSAVEVAFSLICGCPPTLVLPTVFLRIRLIEETDGSVSRLQTPSARSFSRISHANRELFDSLYRRICSITIGVETRGLLPPIAPGNIDPVSANLARILETQP